MKNFKFDNPALTGLKYEELNDMTAEYLQKTDPESLNEAGRKKYEFKKLNMHRIKRAHKIYKPGEEILDLINQIDSPQLWMVITEDWCGDSAQNLPYFSIIANHNSNIKLRIIGRDENPEVMDQYLTNGSRSIPKLVAFDEKGNELFQWGPRPRAAKELVDQLKSEGYSKEQFNEKLHLWYGRDRGKSLESEIIELVRSVVDKNNLVTSD